MIVCLACIITQRPEKVTKAFPLQVIFYAKKELSYMEGF